CVGGYRETWISQSQLQQLRYSKSASTYLWLPYMTNPPANK
ncbi:unnamed protein product, partial [Allacma fusca]